MTIQREPPPAAGGPLVVAGPGPIEPGRSQAGGSGGGSDGAEGGADMGKPAPPLPPEAHDLLGDDGDADGDGDGDGGEDSDAEEAQSYVYRGPSGRSR